MYTNRAVRSRRRVSRLPLPKGSILGSLAAIPAMRFGGPGSGCNPEVGDCGRKSTGYAPRQPLGKKQKEVPLTPSHPFHVVNPNMPLVVKDSLRRMNHQPKGVKALDPTELRSLSSDLKDHVAQREWALATASILKISMEAMDWLDHPGRIADWGTRIGAAVWAIHHLANHLLVATGPVHVVLHAFVQAAAPHVVSLVNFMATAMTMGLGAAEEKKFKLVVPENP